MIRKLLNFRSVRKFRRNRLALAALVVIVGYALIGLAVGVFGMIPLDATLMRVGPKNVPGFFLTQPAEKRLGNAEELLRTVDQAATIRANERSLPPGEQRERIERRLSAIRLGRIRVVDKSIPELREEVTRGYVVYDQLITTANLDEHPELLPKIVELENIVLRLFPRPLGWSGFVQNYMLLLGTDMQGRSIMLRAMYSIQIALQIGLVTALASVLIGSVLGAAAAYFGGWVDHVVTWLFTTFSSIPNIVLLILVAYVFMGTILEDTLWALYIAFTLTYWIGPCRVIRGETLKLKEMEYVQAATAVGYSRVYIMIRHILPNASHLMLINFSLLFIGAIKAEVILTYLGLGIKKGTSWGKMIDFSRSEVLNGFFWQIGAATAFMFVLVLAFNILSDALQDAFDPKAQ